MREWKQEQWLQIAGVNVVLREDQENAINGKQKDSVREEIVVVSGTMRISVQNRHQRPLLPTEKDGRYTPIRKSLRGRSPWEVSSAAVQRSHQR